MQEWRSLRILPWVWNFYCSFSLHFRLKKRLWLSCKNYVVKSSPENPLPLPMYRNDFIQLRRQWPFLLQIKICLTSQLIKSLSQYRYNFLSKSIYLRYWFNPYKVGWILTFCNRRHWRHNWVKLFRFLTIFR